MMHNMSRNYYAPLADPERGGGGGGGGGGVEGVEGRVRGAAETPFDFSFKKFEFDKFLIPYLS